MRLLARMSEKPLPEPIIHWNENVVILMKSSSLAAPKVVILTTFGAASDEDFVKMKTFPFQCNDQVIWSHMASLGLNELNALQIWQMHKSIVERDIHDFPENNVWLGIVCKISWNSWKQKYFYLHIS